MPYFVQIRLSPDQENVPEEVRNDHLTFLDQNIEIVLAAGGLLDDSGTSALGGFYVLDIDERDAVEDLVRQDPYLKTGIFTLVQVTRWRKAYFDRKRLI